MKRWLADRGYWSWEDFVFPALPIVCLVIFFVVWDVIR